MSKTLWNLLYDIHHAIESCIYQIETRGEVDGFCEHGIRNVRWSLVCLDRSPFSLANQDELGNAADSVLNAVIHALHDDTGPALCCLENAKRHLEAPMLEAMENGIAVAKLLLEPYEAAES